MRLEGLGPQLGDHLGKAGVAERTLDRLPAEVPRVEGELGTHDGLLLVADEVAGVVVRMPGVRKSLSLCFLRQHFESRLR